jgi:hypothetical protein
MRLRAPVLRRRFDSCAKLGRSMPGPARIVEHGACKGDEISLAARDDILGLFGASDKADRNSIDLRSVLVEL